MKVWNMQGKECHSCRWHGRVEPVFHSQIGGSKLRKKKEIQFFFSYLKVYIHETTQYNNTEKENLFTAMGPLGGLLRDLTKCLPLKQQKAISHASCSKWKPEISVWNVMTLPNPCRHAAKRRRSSFIIPKNEEGKEIQHRRKRFTQVWRSKNEERF